MPLSEELLIVDLRVVGICAVGDHGGTSEWCCGSTIPGGRLGGDADLVDGVKVWGCTVHLDHVGAVSWQISAADIVLADSRRGVDICLGLWIECGLSRGLVRVVVLHVGGRRYLVIGVHPFRGHGLRVPWYLQSPVVGGGWERKGEPRVFLDYFGFAAAGFVFVVGMADAVLGLKTFRFVDVRNLVFLGQNSPLQTERFRDLRVVHSRMLGGHLASHVTWPHHERVHWSLDVLLGVLRRRRLLGVRRHRPGLWIVGCHFLAKSL